MVDVKGAPNDICDESTTCTRFLLFFSAFVIFTVITDVIFLLLYENNYQDMAA